MDARWFQIIFLISFLLIGVLARDFALTPMQLVLASVSALLTQAAWLWHFDFVNKRDGNAYMSAIVTTLGVCILVRSENAWVHPLLLTIAISSKFLVRAGSMPYKSHVFNPANLAAALAVLCMPGSWISPGQWGAGSLVSLWLVALGGLVTQRIRRWDVSAVFLSCWALLLAGRLAYLGYAWQPGVGMWLQEMGTGSVLLFAFFMISDPMTTPQHRTARFFYATLVAVAAFIWQYLLYRPHGLIMALFALCWTVPLLNGLWPHRRFAWSAPR